ncbi:MAG: chloride channel protein [Byssovorax sp.]
MKKGPPPDSATSTPLETARGWPDRAWRRLRTVLRLRRTYFLRAQSRFAPTEAQRLFVLTLIIGVLCGLVAVAFHLTIQLLEHLLIDRAVAAPGKWWIGWTIVTPTIGGLVCGVLLHYVVPNARGSGVPQVKVAFAVKSGRVRARDSIGKFFISSIQLGSGASLGREGPTVQICAGVSSLLGRLVGVSPKGLRRLLPVGVAAGIAAAFNAPIAAVTFTIEEVIGNLDQSLLTGVIIAAALAAVIERSVLGEHPVFSVPQDYGLHHASSLLIYALIGLASAVVSVAFTDSLINLRGWFKRSRIPGWGRPAIGGAATGLLAVVALGTMQVQGVTGGGYGMLGQALTGNIGVRVMLVLCLMKVVATVFSYSSGGAGGIFAPALFIGGMLGGALGALDHVLLGHLGEPVGAFALVGMGAVFAGIIRAPMTSVLIIIEMTGSYSLILPLMIANMTSYILARRFRPLPIYEALLEQDGIHLNDRSVMDALEGLRVSEIVDLVGPFSTFSPAQGGDAVSKATGGNPGLDVYPVIDGARRLCGIITTDELKILASDPQLLLLFTASDLMRPGVSVGLDDDVHSALAAMVEHGVRQVPVIDPDGRFVGFIDEAAVAKAYLRVKRPNSAPGEGHVHKA